MYGFDTTPYFTAIENAKAILELNDSNDGRAEVNQAINSLKSYLQETNIYKSHLDGLLKQLNDTTLYLMSPIISEPESITDVSNTTENNPNYTIGIVLGVALIVIAVIAGVLVKRKNQW